MKVNGTKYQTPCVLVIGMEDDEPIFGDIISILVLGKTVYFEFKLLESNFCHHYHAYSLSFPISRKYIIKHCNLSSYHPYSMYHATYDSVSSTYVVLRNKIY